MFVCSREFQITTVELVNIVLISIPFFFVIGEIQSKTKTYSFYNNKKQRKNVNSHIKAPGVIERLPFSQVK